MKKTTEKESLFSQIKAIPNQVKVFILGLFVVVLALASVLPNLNSKSLQGSVLNIKMSSKVAGYGYGYEPPYIFIDDDGYGYGYQVDENTQKYIRIRNVDFYFDEVSSILTVKVKYSPRYQGTMVVEPSIYLVEPSQINYGFTNPSYIGKCFVMENNDICTIEQNFVINKSLHGNQIKVTPVFKTRVTAVSNNDQRALGQIIINNNSTGNIICQTPENILACSLMLSDCPSQCRPAHCQTPENILACSLGLDSCPQECRYGWNNGTGFGADMTLANLSHTVDGKDINFTWNKLAGSNKIDISMAIPGTSEFSNIATVNMDDQKYSVTVSYGKHIFRFTPDNGGKEAIYEVENGTSSYRTDWLNRDGPSGKGDYELYTDFNPTPCKELYEPSYKPTDVEFIRKDGGSVQNVHIEKGGYCLNSENDGACADYTVRFYCEQTINNSNEKPVVAKEIGKPTEVIETVEAVETTIVAEATEEITKERADSLLEMVKNIFK